MQNAPLIVVPMSNKDAYLDRYTEADKGWTDRAEARWAVPYWHINTGMATLAMLLSAVDEGLGACFFAIMPEHLEGFRAEFNVPSGYDPIGAITVGHRTSGQPTARFEQRQRDIADVVHDGCWGQPWPGA
ncbi:nitroreductase family protein [Nocardia sp. NPDC127526]|uniref:nitroreductase family protein n=1 Tax=Nocardia sp. NPDC127526 TaxID=3345393 RepID=UPI003640F8D5